MSRDIRPSNELMNEILTGISQDINTGILDITTDTFKAEFVMKPTEKKAKIVITKNAWDKMTQLIEQCDKEVAWHAMVEKETSNKYIITDVMVFPQTVTGCTVTSDQKEYTDWIMGLSDEDFEKLRCHMHSHVNMGVSPSGVDTKYQNELIQNEENFYIFMIWNKKGTHWCTIVDILENILYFDEDIEVETPTQNVMNWAAEQIKAFVKNAVTYKPTPKTTNIMTSKPGSPYTYRDYQKELVKQMSTAQDIDDDYRDEAWDTELDRLMGWRGKYE